MGAGVDDDDNADDDDDDGDDDEDDEDDSADEDDEDNNDDDDDDDDENDCADEDSDDSSIVDCDFCPWIKEKVNNYINDRIVSYAFHKQQMRLIASILSYVTQNNNVADPGEVKEKSYEILTLILRSKNHSERQQLELFDLATNMGLVMSKDIVKMWKGVMLHTSVNEGSLGDVRSLQSNGADVNYKNIYGLNAVQAFYKSKEQTPEFYTIFEYLLENRLDVIDPCFYGYMVALNKTYVDYKTGNVFHRGYEKEIQLIAMHREVPLMYGWGFYKSRADYVSEGAYSKMLSLPVMCTFVQAGYIFEHLLRRICHDGVKSETKQLSLFSGIKKCHHHFVFKSKT